MPKKKKYDQATPPEPLRVAAPEEKLFEDFDDACGPSEAVVVREDGLPAVDAAMTPDQKKAFVEMIRKEMPLEERARRLADLARLHGTKTAAVGLRAIIEMNLLDDMRKEQPSEDKPMFVVPDDSKVAILVQKVEK